MSTTVQEQQLKDPAKAISAEQDAQPPKACQKVGFFVGTDMPADDSPVRFGPGAAEQSRPTRLWAELPTLGTVHLWIAPGERPRIEIERPARAAEAIAIEPVFHDGRPMVVMHRPGRDVRINGLPAPRVAVLRVGDRLTFGDNPWVLHLSLFSRPYHGPRLDEHVGMKCLCCRQPFPEIGDVYVCPACQTPAHRQGPEVPAEQRLECARMISQCMHCGAPITTKEGFAYVPE